MFLLFQEGIFRFQSLAFGGCKISFCKSQAYPRVHRLSFPTFRLLGLATCIGCIAGAALMGATTGSVLRGPGWGAGVFCEIWNGCQWLGDAVAITVSIYIMCLYVCIEKQTHTHIYIYIYVKHTHIYIYMLEGPPCTMWRPCSFPYFLYFLYLLLETSS